MCVCVCTGRLIYCFFIVYDKNYIYIYIYIYIYTHTTWCSDVMLMLGVSFNFMFVSQVIYVIIRQTVLCSNISLHIVKCSVLGVQLQ